MALKRKRKVHRQEDTSNKQHKFRSFSERIDSLNIDVLRRVRPLIPDSGADDDETYVFSYFAESVKKWKDLNLSATFTEFYRRILPVSESLPQVIHHQDQIVSILEEYIGKNDPLAMNSLLDMLVQLARDLGEDFYTNYWVRTVTLLSQSANHNDFSVIEASFNTLSWLLKYLARPLVANIDSTFHQLSPLIGKSRQKHYVKRFASEAFAFLLRRLKEPNLIVNVMLDDLQNVDNAEYRQAISNIFIESMRAPGKTLHSKALLLFSTLVEVVSETSSESSLQLLHDVLQQVLHNTSAEALVPVIQWVVDYYLGHVGKEAEDLAIDLLLLCCTVKDGDRIKDWSTFSRRLAVLTVNTSFDSKEKYLLVAHIVARNRNSMEETFALFEKELTEPRTHSPDVLPCCQLELLCRFIGKLNIVHFQTSILPRFATYCLHERQQLILRFLNWFDDDWYYQYLCLAILSFEEDALLPESAGIVPRGAGLLGGHVIKGSSTFIQELVKRLHKSLERKSLDLELWRELYILNILDLQSDVVDEHIVQLCSPSRFQNFGSNAMGLILSLRAKGNNRRGIVELSRLVSEELKRGTCDVVFLKGFEKFLRIYEQDVDFTSTTQDQRSCLEENLAYPSFQVRSLSLRCLLHLSKLPPTFDSPVFEAMLSINETPRTVENIRSISLALRRLPALSSPETDSALIYFCFGLLSVNFTPIWNDVCGVLKVVAERSGPKVWEIAYARMTTETDETSENEVQKPSGEGLSLQESLDTIWEDSQLDANDRLERLYERSLAKSKPDAHASQRSQVLRALLEIPQLAERHSSKLVPLFLAVYETSHDTSLKWHRPDRISLLKLFTKFTNPRALSKATQVRSVLCTLLYNGDANIQKLALDAILTWKDIELVTYKEQLHNLLDDRKFRDELTNLLLVSDEDSPVQEQHRTVLMEVVVRILFGIGSGRQDNESKRNAVLAALANLRPTEKRLFIDLALLPFAETRGATHRGLERYELDHEKSSRFVEERKMLGYLMMLQRLAKALGGGIGEFLPELLDALIVCMWKSKLTSGGNDDDSDVVILESDDKNTKAIRKSSMKVLSLLINTCPDYDEWPAYIELVLEEFLIRRLPTLEYENIQSPSTVLQLIETLSRYRFTVLLGSGYWLIMLLSAASLCLENPSAELSVFQTVLRIFSNAYGFSEDAIAAEQSPVPGLHDLLQGLTVILTDQRFQHVVGDKETLDLITEVLRQAAPFVNTTEYAEGLIEPLLSLLGKPEKLVNGKVKATILESVVNLLPLCNDFKNDRAIFERRLFAFSKLFENLNNRASRISLCQTITLFGDVDSSLVVIGDLVTDLNSYDTRKVDVPDFDRRLAGFAELNEELYMALTPRAWTPVVYNLLYFVKDHEELSLRTGASFGLQRFFSAASSKNLSPEFTNLISTAIYPSIKRGLKHSNELIRKEFVGVLDSLVKNCSEWPPISDLKVLLAGGDEEANFFNNIQHIQLHRRLRAITRLSKAASDGELTSSNIEQIFIPMLEKFSLDESHDMQNLAAEAVRAIGILSGELGWKAYRQLVRGYLSKMKGGEEKERAVVRTLCAVVENVGKVAEARAQRLKDKERDQERDADNNEPTIQSPSEDLVVRAVVQEFYPPMLSYLHHHEESTISLRVPVAIALVKVLMALPEEVLNGKLPPVISDVCHILRSRSQESRDICRKTLNTVMSLLGSKYFSFVLGGLKSALARGYQLHVLGYTLHSLLSHLPAEYGSLDYCVKNIVDVLLDDVFGATGTEKDSEGYTTSMKEVKSTKSYDSFEIIASITSSDHMSTVISPLKAYMYEMGSVKDGRKMTEVFRRIQLGLLRNTGATPDEILEFAISLFKSTQSDLINVEKPRDEGTPNQFIVDLKFRRKFEVNHFKVNAPKLLRFALETISALLKKHESLLVEKKVEHLIPILGDCLLSDSDELRIPSIRLLGRLISLPIPAIDDGVEVFVDRAIQFIKESPLTKSELCQASLKFLSLLLRDRKSFSPRENTIIYLLERIRPDLEEPDRQGVSFSLIRSILGRKLFISEVYDTMAAISNIMITNQARSVRDTTRALYLQFLLDYPQGRSRLRKQISFLVKNLQYEHESGRQSVMEVIHQLIPRMGEEELQGVLLDLFVGLLLPLVNDESATCREMASKLIESIIEHADDERLKTIRTMLRLWAKESEKPALLKASLQVYRILLQRSTKNNDDIDLCVDCVSDIIIRSGEGERTKAQWEVTEQASHLMTILVKSVAATMFSSDRVELWSAVGKLLMSDHIALRLTSSKLFGILFSKVESQEAGGLKVETLLLEVSDLVSLARQFLQQIKSAESTNEIGLQAIKNLIFIGRHFYQTDSLFPQKKKNEDTEEKTCFTWLVTRVAEEIRYEQTVAEHVGVARKLLVQWMVAMISVLTADDLLEYGETFIGSLSRFTEETPVASILKSSYKETREIADEGLKLIQNSIGTTAYLSLFNRVRQGVLETRSERRIKRSIGAVTHPERAAKKKIRQHIKSKDNRKRKNQEFKRKRVEFSG